MLRHSDQPGHIMRSGESWFSFNCAPADPAFNMALDEALLLAGPRLDGPVLRFYSWSQPAATFGYFQKYAAMTQLTPLRPLIRRPTGGGLVEHDFDWTYSLVFPPHHPWHQLPATASYQRLHEWQQQAFARLNLVGSLATQPQTGPPSSCFSRPEQHDLLIDGKKIAGAAQRRTRSGFLIQGSVRPPTATVRRTDWQAAWQKIISETLAVAWNEFAPDSNLIKKARQLADQKYSMDSYNQKIY